MTALLIAVALLSVVSACCFRVGSWHQHEADFWRHIHILDLAGLAPRDAPALLAWSRAHPPSLFAKLLGWQAPHDRRRTTIGGYSAGSTPASSLRPPGRRNHEPSS